jgi:hypothetical protein
MKCQKTYYPTPLSTLQKLTIQIQRPDGSLVSDSLDTLDVDSFRFSTSALLGGVIAGSGTSYYIDAAGSYIWIKTTAWFSKFMVSQGDRIIFKNLVFPSSFTVTPASTDFLNFIQRSQGHVVIDLANSTSSTTYVTGANAVGYCNYIIIKNNFSDPTTGGTAPVNFGGTSTTDTAFRTAINGSSGSNISVTMASGRLINMNHQTQVVLRVITRDMDSASHLRPDNN